jgi:hypothetical protein
MSSKEDTEKTTGRQREDNEKTTYNDSIEEMKKQGKEKRGRMKHTWKLFVMVLLLLAMTVVLSGCLPGDGAHHADRPAGFLMGIWHGWMAPISLIVALFDHDITIYEVHNTGWFYDLGYYMAVISGFGGIALSRKTRREKVIVRE